MFALSISTLDVFGIWLTYLKIHLLLLLFKHVRGYLSQFRIILHYTVYEITSNPIMNSHHYHFIITRVLKFQASHIGFLAERIISSTLFD